MPPFAPYTFWAYIQLLEDKLREGKVYWRVANACTENKGQYGVADACHEQRAIRRGKAVERPLYCIETQEEKKMEEKLEKIS